MKIRLFCPVYGIFAGFLLYAISANGADLLFDQFQVRSDLFSSVVLERSSVNPVAESHRGSLECPRFYEDVDLYLGQRRQRNHTGGRIWANFYYSGAVMHPQEETNKIGSNIYGIQVGLDIVRSQIAYLSFFYNYNHSKTGIEDFCNSKIDNHFVGMGYFLYLSAFHWGVMGGAGYDAYKTKTTFLNYPSGYGLQTNLFTEAGIDLKFGNFAFKPFMALQHDFVYHGGIGGGEDLVQGEWNDQSASSLIGLRVNVAPIEALDFQFRATWVHELLDNPPPFYIARFSAVPGTSTPAIFHYQGNTGRDFAWLGVGMKFEFGYKKFIFIDYDVMFNKYLTSHLGNIGLCLGWYLPTSRRQVRYLHSIEPVLRESKSGVPDVAARRSATYHPHFESEQRKIAGV